MNIGDNVKHKSSHIQMTIESIEDGVATCSWFDDSKPCREKYPLKVLDEVKDETLAPLDQEKFRLV